MGRWKKVALGAVGVVAAVAVAAGVYVKVQASACDASLAKVYDVPAPSVTRSTDPAVLARGEHVGRALAGCATRDCHGSDLGGGQPLPLGPIGTARGPNISSKGVIAAYSDGELARLVKHGLKRDGRTVWFMPAQDFAWLPDADIAALVSWLRAAPPVDKPSPPSDFTVMAKVFDRHDAFALDVARRIDHAKLETPPAPAPTPEYGRYVVRVCTGCHGEELSGGQIPGTPPSIPPAANLTKHATGLADWTYEDFTKLLNTGVHKSGAKLHAIMPFEAFARMDDTEKAALWAHLRAMPPRAFGNR
jgi:cytochrome c5